jgi:dihydrofolate reductase
MVSNVDELFAEIKKYPPEKVFVIGGAMLYKLLLPYCTEVLVTKVDAVGGADTFFENLDINPNFALCYSSNEMDTNGYTIKFTTYKNLKVSNF